MKVRTVRKLVRSNLRRQRALQWLVSICMTPILAFSLYQWFIVGEHEWQHAVMVTFGSAMWIVMSFVYYRLKVHSVPALAYLDTLQDEQEVAVPWLDQK